MDEPAAQAVFKRFCKTVVSAERLTSPASGLVTLMPLPGWALTEVISPDPTSSVSQITLPSTPISLIEEPSAHVAATRF